MIAVDTNILVYAHREDSPWHPLAFECLRGLAESRKQWCIPWPCIHEFYSIVTHPKIFSPPTPAPVAIDQIEAWMESPSLTIVSESVQYWNELKAVLEAGFISGPMVHDARVAAICKIHGVGELWTADRDFSRFPGLKNKNPMISQEA